MDTKFLQEIKQRYGIVGNSDGLNRALDVALQVAQTDLSVLIVGESGVGKEILPRIIHDRSPRRRANYLAINCGSIPEGTIDSELFGHEKGSFTGAIGESAGYFGTANGGTLFLDEVGELPLATQARLLRVLETGEYIRVGGQQVMKTDVRVVAATNVNIRKAISEGRFREDLYYRLNTIPIQMPPLRDRGQDIVLLFRLFALQMAEKYRLPRISLTDEAKPLLMQYKWPGNVRELKNVTERLSVLSPEREISREILRQFIPQDAESTQLTVVNTSGKHSYENEREMLYKMLYELGNNVTDLRKELNSLRQQIDDKVVLTEEANQQLQNAAYSSMVPVQGAVHQQQGYASQSSEFMDAEAVEIKEPETLNLGDIERQTIERALERNSGNRRKTAQELGMSDRTLYRRLKEYGLLKNASAEED